MQNNTKYHILNTIYRLVIVIVIIIVSIPSMALAAVWDIKPYLFEFISEKIVGRAIYIEFKVLDDRCVEMRPGLTGEVDWGDGGKITKLERLNCERWRIPHIYKLASTYTITVKVENLTATIPDVTIAEAVAMSAGVNPPTTPTSPPNLPPVAPNVPTPPLSMPPSAPPLTQSGGRTTDFTANFECKKKEIVVGEPLECKAIGISSSADPDEFIFEWSVNCDEPDFPFEGQGDREISHTFSKPQSCYLNLSTTHLSSGASKSGAATLIKIKEKSAFRSFFDSLFAFLNPPKKQIKKAREEVAIAEIKKMRHGYISARLAKNPSDLKIGACRLNFGDGTYLAISDFSKQYEYRYQASGAYVLSLACLNEKNKELRSSFGIEIDIIE